MIVNRISPKHTVQQAREFGDLGAIIPHNEEELSSAVQYLHSINPPVPGGTPPVVLKLVLVVNPRISLLIQRYILFRLNGHPTGPYPIV